jgi:hypothetical protein
MTATVISFRTRRTIAPDHVGVLAEVLLRDRCRCAHCRAPGGAAVLYGAMGHRDVYVVLDTLQAFDCISGEALGTVPADAIPIGVSARVVLDLAYLDGDSSNVGRKGRRPNVLLLCQQCARRQTAPKWPLWKPA